MEIKELMQGHDAIMVEFYDHSEASAEADRLVAEVKKILGADAPVYRIDATKDHRVKLAAVPEIIIYRNRREEWCITAPWPTAEELADRLTESDVAPGAVNPLKGRPRTW